MKRIIIFFALSIISFYSNAQESVRLLDSLATAYKHQNVVIYEFTTIEKTTVHGELRELINLPDSTKITLATTHMSVFSDIVLSEDRENVWEQYVEFMQNLNLYPEHIRIATIRDIHFQEFFRTCIVFGFTLTHPEMDYPDYSYKKGWNNSVQEGTTVKIHIIRNKQSH